jgi:hypothetical protein
MTDSVPPPFERTGQPTRAVFVLDVIVLQVKLMLANLHNFILIPATLIAAALDLVFKSGPHGSRFYQVLEWGRQAEEAIGVYRALDDIGPGESNATRGAAEAPALLPPVEDAP